MSDRFLGRHVVAVPGPAKYAVIVTVDAQAIVSVGGDGGGDTNTVNKHFSRRT